MNHNQLIADLREENLKFRQALYDIFDYFAEERPWNQVDAPGHTHKVPGVWDMENAVHLRGTKCEWCAKWNKAKEMIS